MPPLLRHQLPLRCLAQSLRTVLDHSTGIQAVQALIHPPPQSQTPVAGDWSLRAGSHTSDTEVHTALQPPKLVSGTVSGGLGLGHARAACRPPAVDGSP